MIKTAILSTALAAGLGAFAVAPVAPQSISVNPPGYTNGGRDCRTVEKRVIKDGRTVITREKRCDGDRRVYRDGNDRYVERREPGVNFNIGR